MKTILLIDDDPDDREIFEETLVSLNIAVHFEQAKNGLEALEKLHSVSFRKPDLIFLDLNMPVMDGRQFLTTIKQRQELRDIPVIIYTTSSHEKDREFALENQAAMFMTKHYSVSMLEKEMREVLTGFLDL